MTLFFNNRLFISLLSSSLSLTFLVAPGYAMDSDSDDEGLSSSGATPSPALELQGDPYSTEYCNQASNLFYRGSKEEKAAMLPMIRKAAQDLNNPNRVDFANILSFYYNPQPDKELALDIFRDMVYNSADPTLTVKAAERLCWNGNAEDKKTSVTVLKKVVENRAHPQYLSVVNTFLRLQEEKEHSEQLSEETQLNLLPAFSMPNAHTQPCLLELLWIPLKSQYPSVSQKAEHIFLENPLKFMGSESFYKKIHQFLIKQEETKKNVYLQKTCEALQSDYDPLDNIEYFNASCFVLKMSAQEQFVNLAKKVFLKVMENPLGDQEDLETFFVLQVPALLHCIKDPDLQERIFSGLFDLVTNLKMTNNGRDYLDNNERALSILLGQNDEKIRTKTIDLCKKLIDKVNPTDKEKPISSLCHIAVGLNTIEEGKLLFQQIITLLRPEFEGFFETGALDSDLSLLHLFMRAGIEQEQLKIFNFLKNGITESEEGGEGVDDDVKEATDVIIETLGVDHAWSQEIIELATKFQNSDNPNSSFAVHKQLKERLKEPVVHHLPKYQLEDKRFVRFNLKTLQTRRPFYSIPMKHSEFLVLTQQLVKEAEQYPDQFASFAKNSLFQGPQIALEEANTAFFKNLLDLEGESKKAVSLTSFKLRRILMEVKAFQTEDLHRSSSSSSTSQGLSRASQLILALFNNVLSCPTGKEGGIDQTYRLLTNRRGASEKHLEQDRFDEEVSEFFKEGMRCLREGALSGNGPVVRSLITPLTTAPIDEPPHQAKYLQNLLGAEVGLFLEKQEISFDPNGECVSSELREHSRQVTLDTLYRYHTPEKSIKHFYNELKPLGMKGKIDDKHQVSSIVARLLPERINDPAYITSEDEDFIHFSLTPLAVAELLIKTNILEVVKDE